MSRRDTPAMRFILDTDRFHVNVHRLGYQIVDRTKADQEDAAVIVDRDAAFRICNEMNVAWRDGRAA